ncbi:MAG: ABC transporter ATP-binding protein [Myxococcota bacterium]
MTTEVLLAANDPVPKLRLRGLTKSFGKKRVLDGLCLDVYPGESVVIMGPSGEGKSVLLKHMIGLLRPDAGSLEIDGVDFWAASERERNELRRRFGMAFQEGALFDSMTVFENVAFPLRRHTRLREEEIAGRVRECLRMVRLGEVEERRPSELSTGMRRRVGFARAMALQPQILLFDEPTAGLDNVMVTVIDRVITDVHQRLRATTVMVTHDLTSARAVAQRVALLLRGRIVVEAPVDTFFGLAHPAVRQLVEGRLEGPILPEEEAGAFEEVHP